MTTRGKRVDHVVFCLELHIEQAITVRARR
jgi:hypothetical protein